jgi:hypothetical protein
VEREEEGGEMFREATDEGVVNVAGLGTAIYAYFIARSERDAIGGEA